MSNDVRSKLRAKTIGAKKEFKRTEVEYDGDVFEFIQPTLRQRKQIIESSRNDDGEPDDVVLAVEAVIALTVVPGTQDRVFEDTDRESMMDMPAGSFVDVFAQKAVNVMLGIDDDPLEETESDA